MKLNGPKFNIFCGENWDCQGEIMFSEFELNGKKGFAIIEMYKKYVGGSPLPKQQSLRHLTEPGDVLHE